MIVLLNDAAGDHASRSAIIVSMLEIPCTICGASVVDPEKHQLFHDTILLMLNEVKPGIVDDETMAGLAERAAARREAS